MVFEKVLVDILNRFLSPYVKNLDSSQIQVSVWSGDVRLDNLEVKENALEQFNIPVRVHFGFLDKFRAKIPWKNLYNEPTTVEIDVSILDNQSILHQSYTISFYVGSIYHRWT